MLHRLSLAEMSSLDDGKREKKVFTAHREVELLPLCSKYQSQAKSRKTGSSRGTASPPPECRKEELAIQP